MISGLAQSFASEFVCACFMLSVPYFSVQGQPLISIDLPKILLQNRSLKVCKVLVQPIWSHLSVPT